MLCDPCYIVDQWKDTEMVDIRRHRDKRTGRVFQLDLGSISSAERNILHDTDETFPNYGAVLSTGKTANQHGENGDWEDIDDSHHGPPAGEFSYAGCCKATIKTGHGQLNYEMGHAGAGVVFSTGYGDGCYPVYATYGEDGRVAKVEVIFMEDEDER
jgi:hypothetical protein